MDPVEIFAAVAGIGGGIAVLGGGAWAVLRTRGKSDQDPTQKSSTSSGSESRSASSGTSTAVKERPAAPTWEDTLTAGRQGAP